ncbi:methyltransferase [Marinimicrobium alkaliphilum]|uniref:methyltransferase n=1 Tax=Marinimicrobium alkaliphilum TaxID=2202654 RepID=UPI000DBA332D|nr:methyltransferase [Marinimicrobium alkaliphilum]
MSDAPLHWLDQQIRRTQGRTLLCADDATAALLANAPNWPHKPRLISNRWDIAELARAHELDTDFNDFDLDAIEDHSLDAMFYRVSKEKPVVHHLINQAARVLKPGGRLLLCGLKNEGTKTYIDKAGQRLGNPGRAEKIGEVYAAVLVASPNANANQALDTDDYPRLRPIAEHGNLTFWSKPGLFGWKKIDQGSALLIEQLNSLRPSLPEPLSLLDLGCGYGYLSLMSAHLPAHRRVLTDNNAAALLAARHNMHSAGIEADVIPANAGDALNERFDLILCNPPFHQGFAVEGELTERFLTAAARLLAPGGTSLWVVNAFIPLERKAERHFSQVRELARTPSFKVLALSQIQLAG